MNIHPLKQDQDNGAPKDKQRVVAIHKLIPNLITLTALAAGIMAIQLAFDGYWDRAVLAIIIAAILDALDGATARLLKATSEFGAQLDSLSDFLAFGVAPALVLYAWVLEESGPIGWIAMLAYAAACALRLARYNVMQHKKLPVWKRGFFAGIPAPAGAGLSLLPIFIWLQDPEFFEKLAFANFLVGFWVLAVAALMISRIPTFSTKQLKLPAKMAMPALAAAALLIAALVQAPWPTLTVMAIAYLVSIPFAVRYFLKLQKKHADTEDLTDLALGALSYDDLKKKD